MIYYASTIRNGRYLCGNVGHVSNVRRDLKTLKGAIAWAKRLAKANAKPGDMIVIEQASIDRPYEFSFAAKFIHYA